MTTTNSTGSSVFVTGGAGFVGSQVVRDLVDAGAVVSVLDNFSTGRRHFIPDSDRIRVIECDLRDRAAVRDAIVSTRPAVVIHLAAIHYIPYCDQHPVEAVDVNVTGTRNLLSACRESRPSKLFFTSTAAVYPIRTGPNSESSETGPTDIYGNTKLVGEELAELFFRQTGVATRIGRLFNVFGPRETNPHVIPEIIAQLSDGVREVKLGNLEPKRDYIHVSDVSRAILSVNAASEHGFDVFNIGTGRQYSVREVVAAAELALNEPLLITRDEYRTRASDRLELLADVSKIRSVTAWQPHIDFRSGLRQLLIG